MKIRQLTRGKRLLLVAGTIVLLAAIGACRPWKHKSPEERAEWMSKRVAKELDLNDTQKQTLTRIKEELLAKHRAEKPRMEEQLADLNQLIRSESVDKAKLGDLRKKHQAHREAMEAFFIEKAVEFHKVLTAEQRNKAADMLQKHMKHFSGEK